MIHKAGRQSKHYFLVFNTNHLSFHPRFRKKYTYYFKVYRNIYGFNHLETWIFKNNFPLFIENNLVHTNGEDAKVSKCVFKFYLKEYLGINIGSGPLSH